MAKKKKMPPEMVEYFKNKNKKKEDGSEMNDKEKREDAIKNTDKKVAPEKDIKKQTKEDKLALLEKARKAKKAAKTYKNKK
ncbi:MAG: hypothetical protein Tp158DCM1229571_12 [Prokaryotic dsDNA virus sp.]|nr:MAG: hypothetical protein Tp158DCM1229571_12 [Prokaryotic dsDNA virus sp.]|tara:strand:- start:148 stop:390 length:243 start_codon:yes stop_codon:yes gene_type:complete